MKVLFLGGTGIISSAASDLAIQNGIDLYHLNRGNSKSMRQPNSNVTTLIADLRNPKEVAEAIGSLSFDVVVDWLSFNVAQLSQSIELVKSKTKQYIFISSASVYQTPPRTLPVTEKTPIENPFWLYAREKISCEHYIHSLTGKTEIQFTIVRPSHTYDVTRVPITGNYTSVQRMKMGKPAIVVGDGTSIWTLTHHRDFAVGIVGLFLNEKAYNETFHITSDEWLTWNQIVETVASAFNIEPIIKPVPSKLIYQYDHEFGEGMLGDKMHSMIFDNSKIKAAVPDFNCKIKFEAGAKEMAEWHFSHPEQVDYQKNVDDLFDRILADLSKIGF